MIEYTYEKCKWEEESQEHKQILKWDRNVSNKMLYNKLFTSVMTQYKFESCWCMLLEQSLKWRFKM